MTLQPAPVLLVLDDREGLVRTAPGMKALGDLCDVRVVDRPLQDVPDEDLTDVRVLLAVRERTRLDAATLRRFPRLELLLQTALTPTTWTPRSWPDATFRWLSGGTPRPCGLPCRADPAAHACLHAPTWARHPRRSAAASGLRWSDAPSRGVVWECSAWADTASGSPSSAASWAWRSWSWDRAARARRAARRRRGGLVRTASCCCRSAMS